MKTETKLTILASYTKDRIFDENGVLLREQKGGPAYFISNVFKKLGLSYSVHKTPLLIVDAVVEEGNDILKLPSASPHIIDYKSIKTPLLIMSPIIGEFDLSGIENYEGNLFVDVQGFTRVVGKYGKKKKWITTKKIEKAIYCLKVSDHELQYVSKAFLNAQKKKLLLITQGEKGCTIYASGKKFIVKPKKILHAPDTLGAGDTFFAYFIAEYIKTNDLKKSAEVATVKASEFLMTKKQK